MSDFGTDFENLLPENQPTRLYMKSDGYLSNIPMNDDYRTYIRVDQIEIVLLKDSKLPKSFYLTLCDEGYFAHSQKRILESDIEYIATVPIVVQGGEQ